MTITPGRLVTVLTPVLFAPLAGTISVLAAEHVPGLNIDRGALEEIFIAGAVIAFGKAGLWLKGWQDYERREQALPGDVADDVALEASLAEGPVLGADAADGFDEAFAVDADEPDLDEDNDFDDDLFDEEDDELLTPAAGSRE